MKEYKTIEDEINEASVVLENITQRIHRQKEERYYYYDIAGYLTSARGLLDKALNYVKREKESK